MFAQNPFAKRASIDLIFSVAIKLNMLIQNQPVIINSSFSQHPTPSVQKYACHVFISDSSTRCVAEAYG